MTGKRADSKAAGASQNDQPATPLAGRPKKSRDVTSARQLEADVYARLSKREAHADIAASLGVSREHVTRIAAKFRERLEEAAEATKSAAIDGALEARDDARNAAPKIMRYCIEAALDEDLAPADRRAFAALVLDRGGVHAKADLDVTVKPLSPAMASQVAAIVRARA